MFVDMKRLKFKRWAVVNHGGGIGGVIITLILSLILRDVWALVIGSVAENLARTVLSFILYPYRPTLAWSREAYRDLIQFSKGLFGLSFLNLIFSRTDIFVLGKLFSPSELGLYTMAVYLVQTPAGFLLNVFGQTLLPTFAHVQNDRDRENKILLQITSVILLLGMPLLVFLYFCGHSILHAAYGHRYTAAAGALVVAGCVALVNLANAQITTVFYARGVPQLHRKAVAVMAIAMVVLIYPSAKSFGLVGGQLASLVAVVIGLLFQVARVRALTGMDMARYSGIFILASAVSMMVPILYLSPRFFVSISSPISNILLGATGCLVGYLVAAAVLWRKKAFL